MHIIGTAGHVDHGKSSLVIALTGHNPDRLIEEQRRGMTLDLGFAPLRFPDGVEAGIVDVPGHERFLHNMLAGAAGMELLLLVVAASEGPKPQTFEHLHILNFLNVTRALIVLSKVDLVDRTSRDIAAQLTRDAVRCTVAHDATIFEVSTVTGEGIPELKTAIHDVLANLPPRRPQSPAYLPIDRVFALPGHGTVVTGTLMQGTVASGDTLALQPSGLRARIKSLQVFGQKVQSASGGTRLAVNLPGIAVDQIARGEALVSAREFVPARDLRVDFTPLAGARAFLRRRTPVRAHIGSAEIPGLLRLHGGPPSDEPTVSADLLLWRPTVFYPGQRIIIRRMSPKDLLGGAVVRDASAAASSAAAVQELETGELADAPSGAADVLSVLTTSGLQPLAIASIAAKANIAQPAAETALAWLVEHGHAVNLQKPFEHLSRTVFDAAWESLQTAIRDRQRSAPWRLGINAADASTTFGVAQGLGLRLLHAWHADGRIAVTAGFWHEPGFAPALNPTQKAFFEKALPTDAQSPYLPSSYPDIAQQAARTSAEVVEALQTLIATGALIRIGDDLYRRSQLEHATKAIAELMAAHGTATMAQLRDVLGTSRKYALPLMEYFDSTGFTVRDGDLRRLRKARQA